MADQTTSSIVIDAEPGEVMGVIGDFASYPEWAKGVQEADGRRGGAPTAGRDGSSSGSTSRRSRTSTPSPTSGTGTHEVTWTLVEGKMLRALDGAYTLRDLGGGRTEVTYRLALDVSIPLIGMLKRKGEKILIDTALKGLKKRVESPR